MIKKISFVFVLLFLVSCGQISKKSDNKNRLVDTKITNTVMEKKYKIISDKESNKEQTYNDKISLTEQKFAMMDRDRQIIIAKNIDCDKLKNSIAKRECIYAQSEMLYNKFYKLSDKDKLKFDCSVFKKHSDKYIELVDTYKHCILYKEKAQNILRELDLQERIKNGDLTYCNESSVKNKPSFNLNNCKIGVIAKSNKDCSVLDNKLQKECNKLKQFLKERNEKILKIKQKKLNKKIEKIKRDNILDIVENNNF